MPASDWQFWVVTGLALVAFATVARAIAPRRRRRGASKKRVQLTIERRPPE
jgi:hypothetical protein